MWKFLPSMSSHLHGRCVQFRISFFYVRTTLCLKSIFELRLSLRHFKYADVFIYHVDLYILYQETGKISWDYDIGTIPVYLYNDSDRTFRLCLEILCVIMVAINCILEVFGTSIYRNSIHILIASHVWMQQTFILQYKNFKCQLIFGVYGML